MRPVRHPDRPIARVLDADRPFLPYWIDLDGDAHERARPAVDQRAVGRGVTLAVDDRAPLRLRALRGPRAHAQAQHRDRWRRILGPGRWLPALETRPARGFGVRLGELHDDTERL